jgi:sec-independent protein translocase protein TatC
MTDILAIFLLILLAILVIGPKRLPEGVEQLWLLWENFRLQRYGAEPITLERARQLWEAQRSLPFITTHFLYETAEHLTELRQRMFIALIGFAICLALAFFFSNQILTLLKAPLKGIQQTTRSINNELYVQQNVVLTTTLSLSDMASPISVTFVIPAGTKLPVGFELPREEAEPIATKPTEVVLTVFKVALYTGLGVAMPIIIYELIAFIMPALLPHEKYYLWFLAPIGLLFIAGVSFAYFLLLPTATQFLFTFGADIARPLPAISDYINFALTLLFIAGLTFQTPLVIYFLSLIGAVDVAKLGRFRRYMIVLAFILAAFITPTPDPLNQALVALPIILLYELGIIFVRLDGMFRRLARRRNPSPQ